MLTFGAKRFVRDLHGGNWVSADARTVRLDAIAPTLLVLSSEQLPLPTVAVAAKATELRLTGAPGEVAHLDFIDPRGEIVRRYSGNALLRDGSAVWPVPFAAGDAGGWTVQARGMLSGGVASVPLDAR